MFVLRKNRALVGSLSSLLIALATSSAFADGTRLRIELGGAIVSSPSYEGSDDYDFSVVPLVQFVSFNSGNLSIGGGSNLGWKFGPSFRYLGERSQSDDASLLGIPNVDDSIEAGLSIGYEWEIARVFVAGRYGFTGHNGFVGEAGADAIFRPNEQIEIGLGPRLSFANEDYMDAYFSVPTTAVNLATYDAGSGIKSAGIGANLRYDINETWAMAGSAQWNRLIGDAGDSPIVKAGSENQFTAKLGFVYKFDLNF